MPRPSTSHALLPDYVTIRCLQRLPWASRRPTDTHVPLTTALSFIHFCAWCHSCGSTGGLSNLPKGPGQTLHLQFDTLRLETDKSICIFTRREATLPFPLFEAALVSDGPYLEGAAIAWYTVPLYNKTGPFPADAAGHLDGPAVAQGERGSQADLYCVQPFGCFGLVSS